MKHEWDQLFDLIAFNNQVPANLQLFLISKNQIFRFFRGHIESSRHTDYNPVRGINWGDHARGDILNTFSKIEFIVNETIRLKILGHEVQNHTLTQIFILNELLENIDFYRKIELLIHQGVIDKEWRNKIMKLKKVRDACAHKYGINEISYDGEPIQNVSNVFMKEIEEFWVYLLSVYEIEQNKIDIKGLIEFIKKGMTGPKERPVSV